MKFKSNLKPSFSLIDLTPLVDVIFLLLIFFIVTSDILPLKSLHIENPPLAKESAPLTTQLLVVMDAQNVIYVGSKKNIVDMYSLKTHLLEEIAALEKVHLGQAPSIVLSVDKQVDYGAFLQLFSVAQECCSKIRLVYHAVQDPKDAEG